MKSPRIASWLVVLLLALTLPTLADTQPLPPVSAPNWYDVEIIVFANTDPQAGVLESWPADPGVPDWSSAVPLKPAASELPYMQLPASSWRLNSAWAKLKRSSDYAPLLHSAWAQPAIDRASALFVRVGTASAPTAAATASSLAAAAMSAPLNIPNAVYGIAKLSTTGPYLHFDLDLVYCGPPAKHMIASTALAASSTAPAASTSPSPAAAPTCQPYRLTEDRKLDAGKLNYFDNPMFGALVLITPRTK